MWHILFAGFKIIEEAVRRLWNQSLMDVRGFIVTYKRGSKGVTLSLGRSVKLFLAYPYKDIKYLIMLLFLNLEPLLV